jgi:hypothetical protein
MWAAPDNASALSFGHKYRNLRLPAPVIKSKRAKAGGKKRCGVTVSACVGNLIYANAAEIEFRHIFK